MMQIETVLEDLHTGIVFQNPKPHVHSIHAYFPSVVQISNRELLAIYSLGEAFEAEDLRTCVARSRDGGQTWHHDDVIDRNSTDRIISNVGKMSMTPEGELVVNLMRHDRTHHREDGLTNPTTMGFVPTEMAITRSLDCGHTWTKPMTIAPPLVGPCFELCSPVTFLADGRWLLPTSTWMDWEGNLPNGNRMVAFVSSDRGQSWPSYLDVMHSPDDNLIFWESKIIEALDGRLLAVAWCYDRQANADRPNQYALSRDGGRSWSLPASTGLIGQTLTPCLLADGRILSVYRRMDRPGLWANVSHLEADRWINDGSQPLWGHASDDGRTTREANMTGTFNKLKFGAPSVIRLDDTTIFMAFWCYEENVGIIRWFRFRVL